MAAVGPRRPPWSRNIASRRKPLLLFLFRLLRLHRRHASCRHDVLNWRMLRSDRFGVEAAETTAPMPTGMLFLTLLGRHHKLSGILPYVFLRRTQPTTTSQRPSTRCDVNRRQRPPWSPTPCAAAYNSHPNVGWMPYAAAPGPGVRHHGSRGTPAATMVDGARFS